MSEISTECSSEIGITIALIDGIIAVSRIMVKKDILADDEKTTILVLLGMLHKRTKTNSEVKEALIDLEDTAEFQKLKKMLKIKN